MGAFDDLIPGGDKPAGAFDDLIPKTDGGFKASAKQTIGQTIKGVGQAAADYLPGVSADNALSRYGQSVVDANPTAVHGFGDLADKPWTGIKETLGNALTGMGGMVAARALGQGITAAAPLTGPAAPLTALLGQGVSWGGPALMAALPSYSGIREAQQQAKPEGADTAADKALALGGSALVGGIESRFGPQDWALKAMSKEGRDALAEKFAAQSLKGAIGKGLVKGAGIEGAEELAQNPIEQLASYRDPTTRESLAETAFGGVMGAIGGGVLGGSGGGLNYLAQGPQKPAGPLSRAAETATATGAAQEQQRMAAAAQEVDRQGAKAGTDAASYSGQSLPEQSQSAVQSAQGEAASAPASQSPLGLPQYSGPTLYTFPDGSTTTDPLAIRAAQEAERIAALAPQPYNAPLEEARATRREQMARAQERARTMPTTNVQSAQKKAAQLTQDTGVPHTVVPTGKEIGGKPLVIVQQEQSNGLQTQGTTQPDAGLQGKAGDEGYRSANSGGAEAGRTDTAANATGQSGAVSAEAGSVNGNIPATAPAEVAAQGGEAQGIEPGRSAGDVARNAAVGGNGGADAQGAAPSLRPAADVRDVAGGGRVDAPKAQGALPAGVETGPVVGMERPVQPQPAQVPTVQSADVPGNAQAPDVSGKTPDQLAYLSTNGQPGWKEAAQAEIARRQTGTPAGQQTQAAPDLAAINVPLSQRGNIDADLDRYKREQAAQAKQDAKTATAQRKVEKARAKELFAQHGEAIIAQHGAKFGDKETRKTLDSMVKWEPAKFIQLAETFQKEQAAQPTSAAPVQSQAAPVVAGPTQTGRTATVEHGKDGGWFVTKRNADGTVAVDRKGFDDHGKALTEKVEWERGTKSNELPYWSHAADMDRAAREGYAAAQKKGAIPEYVPDWVSDDDILISAFKIGAKRGLEEQQGQPNAQPAPSPAVPAGEDVDEAKTVEVAGQAQAPAGEKGAAPRKLTRKPKDDRPEWAQKANISVGDSFDFNLPHEYATGRMTVEHIDKGGVTVRGENGGGTNLRTGIFRMAVGSGKAVLVERSETVSEPQGEPSPSVAPQNSPEQTDQPNPAPAKASEPAVEAGKADDRTLSIEMGGSRIPLKLNKPAWQMTPEEIKEAVASAGYSYQSRGKYDPMRAWYEAHSDALAEAAKAGKPIPAEVLYERTGLIRNDLNDDEHDLAADAMVSTYRATNDYAKAVQAYREWGKAQPSKAADISQGDRPQPDAKNRELSGGQPEQKAERRNLKTATLRNAGNKLIEAATADQSRDRLANTAKRANQAASADADARKREALGKTMVRLADAIDAGTAPKLASLTTRTQIETLEGLLLRGMQKSEQSLSYSEQQKIKGRSPDAKDVRNAEIPQASWHISGSDKIRLLEALKGKRGAGTLATRIRQSNGPDAEMVAEAKRFLSDKEIDYGFGWWNLEAIADAGRLERAGIKTNEDLREALTQYLELRNGAKKADRAKELERSLVGQKVGIDFFPTPPAVAKDMVQQAGIEPGMAVLEPSAGNGNIAKAIQAVGVNPDVVEISDQLRNLLEAHGFNLVGRDFLETQGKYDRIVMNPPFGGGADMAHVQHAHTLLKPGGRVVAIVGEGAFIRNDKQATAFREWLDEQGATVEKLPEGTFNDRTLMNTTGANARMVVIDKDGPAVFRLGDTDSASPLRSNPEAAPMEGVVNREAANGFLRDFLASFPGAPKVAVVDRVSDLPADVRRDAGNQGGQSVKGALNHRDGRVYVVVGNHTSLADFQATVFHEVLGHAGVRALFGKDFVVELNKLFLGLGGGQGLRRIMEQRGMGRQFREYVEGITQAQGKDPRRWTDAIARAVLTEEVFAHIAEQQPQLMPRFQYLIESIRHFLRKVGILKNENLGDKEIIFLLQRARKKLAGKNSTTLRNGVEVGPKGMVDAAGRLIAREGSPEFDALKVLADKLGLSEQAGATVFSVSGRVSGMDDAKNVASEQAPNPAGDGTTWGAVTLFHGSAGGLRGGSFDLTMVGRQRATTEGWGAYFADDKRNAERFGKNLDSLELTPEEVGRMLQFDKRMSEQTTFVRDALRSEYQTQPDDQDLLNLAQQFRRDRFNRNEVETLRAINDGIKWDNGVLSMQGLRDWLNEDAGPLRTHVRSKFLGSEDPTGAQLYRAMARKYGSDKKASSYLLGYGVPGAFFDASADLHAQYIGSNNYLIWDQNILDRGAGEPSAPAGSGAPSVFRMGTADAFNPTFSKAGEVLSDVINTHGSFGLLKGLKTQYHKATLNPLFKGFWERSNAMAMDSARAMSRPADLAQRILPKFDPRNMGEAVKAVFAGRSDVQPADLKAVADALNSGTLDGGPSPTSGHAWTRAELTTPKGEYVPGSGSDGTPRTGRGLTEKQADLYEEARAAVDASLDELATATAWKVANQAVPGSALRDEIASNPQSAPAILDGVLEFAIGNAKDELRLLKQEKADPKAIEDQDKVIDGLEKDRAAIAAIFDKAEELKQAGYMPLMRFGKYRIAVTMRENGKETATYVGRYESHVEANRARRELEQRFNGPGFTVGPVQIENENAWKMFKGVNPETVMLFAEEAGIKADDVMQEWYREAISSRSALRRMIHRTGVEGYSDDLPRVLASFITSNGKQAGYAYHLGDMQEMLQNPDMPGDVQEEAQALLETIQEPNEKGATMRGLMATWYLLGSVGAALVNSTQTVTMSIPWLSQFGSKGFSATEAASAMGKSYKMVLKPITMPADLKAAMKRAEQNGIVDSNEVFHLYAESMKPMISKLGSGDLAYRARAFMTLWGAPFAMVETLNRRATFAAAYGMAKAQGKTEAQASAFAEKAVIETQGIYAKHNRPNWTRGTIGAAALTFKQFAVAYLEMLSRMAKNGPEGKKAALLALGVMFALAGASGLPGEDDLLDAIDTFSQIFFGKPTISKMEIRNFLNDNLGKELGGFINSGVSNFLPVDVSSRLGMGNLIPGTGIFKPSTKDKTGELIEIVGGVQGGFVQSMIDSVRMLAEGNVSGAVKTAAPKAIQDLAKGAEMALTGEARDRAGRKVVDTDGVDAFFQSIGLNPNVKAEASKKAWDVTEYMDYVKRAESNIVGRWARGVVDGDMDAIHEAQQELTEWNMRNPDSPIGVSRAQIMQRVQALRMERAGRIEKMAPRELRSRVRELMDEE